ncbi:MAG: hypothetical protein KKD44_15150 [Proteobacteria bacterium]|nr:hypothetical protein [Pseudomonadota bacterium]
MFKCAQNRLKESYFFIALVLCLAMVLVQDAFAERIFFAGYKGGFYLRSEEEGGMELKLGGALQADYRGYNESQLAGNGFDVRRARLVFRGALTRWVRFGMEYEFQGNETDNLVDAYVEGVNGNHALRFGQFREPFSLEWQCRDKALYFSERSMAWSLSPHRDVGVMLHGQFFNDGLSYALGLFNGDGDDGSSRGNEQDSPEMTGRFVLAPFKNSTLSFINGFQVGASASYANIETLNVNLKVKSSGMAATSINVYDLSHNTKFGVLQDVDSRVRVGLEVAWSVGPLAMMGECIQLSYQGLEPVGQDPKDADFSAWYGAFLWNITGEAILFNRGIMQPVYPNRNFNPDEQTWGAFCLGVRVEHFNGDRDWINTDAHVSTEKADAFSLALNWVLFPMCRMVFDVTHTRMSDPIRVRVLSDGQVDYITRENCFTARCSLDF